MSPDSISKSLAIFDQTAKHRGVLAAFEPAPFQRMMEQQENWNKMFQPSTTQAFLDVAKKFDGFGVGEMPTLPKFLAGEHAPFAGIVAPSLSDAMSNVSKDFAKIGANADLTTLGVTGNFAQAFPPTLIEQLTSQQRMFEGLFKGPEILRMIGTLPTIPTGFIEQVEVFRDGLVEELTDEADVAPEAAEDVLSQVAAQREAILKTLQRLNAAAGGCVIAGAHLPKIVVALMIWFWVFGDVADEILTERASDEPEP